MMNVYFTVDTEASMGGAWSDPDRRPLKADRHIFCRIDGRDHGIGFITDALAIRLSGDPLRGDADDPRQW